jgi:hypothetical protein
MRPVLHGDLVAAARVLLDLPVDQRPFRMQQLIDAADLGDRYRRRFGRPHPRFGNGSLMAAAAAWPMRTEPPLDSSDYLDCLGRVIEALLARHR